MLHLDLGLEGMNVYFAYQTFAGGIMHLVILGAIMGLLLGIIGGFTGRTLHYFKKQAGL